MKKFLIVALAALGFVACNDNLNEVNPGGFSGEVETSYIAINLNAADNTRAEGATYQDGLEAERAVKAAYFFFFDANGDAFPVTANAGNPATAPATEGVNWISANLQDLGVGETPNVSDIKDAVLVLSTYKGTYPSQIVAVINWVPVAGIAYDLDDLYAAANIQGADGGFVMSNAVYSDGTKAVVGTPLTQANIFTNPAEALSNPITIHVERIAAKVTVTANNVTDNRFQVTKKNQDNSSSVVTIPIGGSNIDVYVQVKGWELHNDFSQSKLLKDIDLSWTDLGFNWNDQYYFRSYWAESLGFSDIGTNAFPENFSLDLGNTTNVNNGIYTDDTYTYVGENTNGQQNGTKVILKAQLQQKDGEDYKPLALARWYTTYYAGTEDLLKAVANTIKYQYCSNDGSDNYVYISDKDLTIKKVDNLVQFELSTTGVGKNWYIPNGNGEYTAKTDEQMNALLAGIEKALYYENGETLYYVDIKHLGTPNSVAEYGVVRNHIYNVVLNSFGGFGSPVYVPGGNLTYPDNPADTGEYVSAQINVLSWRLVNQEVDIQPNN